MSDLDMTGLRAELAKSSGRTFPLFREELAALLDRAEQLEEEGENVTENRDYWHGRAEAAEAAVARVEAICQDTDGNWLDPEDECNNVGSILQAVRGTR